MSPSTHQETPVRIQITVDDQRFHATLSDSAAGRDLLALGYYAPGQDLVVHHGDRSSFPGVILGRVDDGAAERIASLNGSLTAVVEGLQR
jgi:hypothetical protein